MCQGEDALLAPIYVGAISSKYVGEDLLSSSRLGHLQGLGQDNRLTGDRRAQAAEALHAAGKRILRSRVDSGLFRRR